MRHEGTFWVLRRPAAKSRCLFSNWPSRTVTSRRCVPTPFRLPARRRPRPREPNFHLFFSPRPKRSDHPSSTIIARDTLMACLLGFLPERLTKYRFSAERPPRAVGARFSPSGAGPWGFAGRESEGRPFAAPRQHCRPDLDLPGPGHLGLGRAQPRQARSKQYATLKCGQAWGAGRRLWEPPACPAIGRGASYGLSCDARPAVLIPPPPFRVLPHRNRLTGRSFRCRPTWVSPVR